MFEYSAHIATFREGRIAARYVESSHAFLCRSGGYLVQLCYVIGVNRFSLLV
jgi:hypothetical protein